MTVVMQSIFNNRKNNKNDINMEALWVIPHDKDGITRVYQKTNASRTVLFFCFLLEL